MRLLQCTCQSARGYGGVLGTPFIPQGYHCYVLQCKRQADPPQTGSLCNTGKCLTLQSTACMCPSSISLQFPSPIKLTMCQSQRLLKKALLKFVLHTLRMVTSCIIIQQASAYRAVMKGMEKMLAAKHTSLTGFRCDKFHPGAAFSAGCFKQCCLSPKQLPSSPSNICQEQLATLHACAWNGLPNLDCLRPLLPISHRREKLCLLRLLQCHNNKIYHMLSTLDHGKVTMAEMLCQDLIKKCCALDCCTDIGSGVFPLRATRKKWLRLSGQMRNLCQRSSEFLIIK